jgi:hypothetical protein
LVHNVFPTTSGVAELAVDEEDAGARDADEVAVAVDDAGAAEDGFASEVTEEVAIGPLVAALDVAALDVTALDVAALDVAAETAALEAVTRLLAGVTALELS